MKIIVCIKQVPDTETRIKIGSDGKSIATADIKYIVNPYDEYAVEEGLKIKEKLGGEVTVVTVGPQRADEAIRECLARGVNNGVRIWDDTFEKIEPLGVAKVLAKAIGNMGYDLIICGKQAIDDDSSQVGILLAEMLGIPQVAIVTKAEVTEKSAKLHRQIEGGTEVVEIPLPGLFTTQKGINEPRYPSLKGKMNAKKAKIEVIDGKSLGVDTTPKIQIQSMSLPPARTKGQILKDVEPAEAAAKLVKYLREEAKVI